MLRGWRNGPVTPAPGDVSPVSHALQKKASQVQGSSRGEEEKKEPCNYAWEACGVRSAVNPVSEKRVTRAFLRCRALLQQ